MPSLFAQKEQPRGQRFLDWNHTSDSGFSKLGCDSLRPAPAKLKTQVGPNMQRCLTQGCVCGQDEEPWLQATPSAAIRGCPLTAGRWLPCKSARLLAQKKLGSAGLFLAFTLHCVHLTRPFRRMGTSKAQAIAVGIDRNDAAKPTQGPGGRRRMSRPSPRGRLKAVAADYCQLLNSPSTRKDLIDPTAP